METPKLTPPQLRRLRYFSEGNDGFSPKYKPDQRLVELGLIERCDITTRQGPVTFTRFRARITILGRQRLEEGA